LPQSRHRKTKGRKRSKGMKLHGGDSRVSVMSPRTTQIVVLGLAAVLVLAAVYLLFANGRSSGAEVTLDGGLKYTDISVGTGASPRLGGQISVNYVGTLENGTEFDRSHGQPVPMTFDTQHLIPGWVKGMENMKVGGKRRLTVPPELAYGAAGRPPVIPPNSTLIFDIDLVDVR
jgi:hypothetical protein